MLEEEKQREVQLDDEHNVYAHAQGELSRGQKIAAFGLGSFAFFIVIIWALQFKSGITDPLDYEKAIEKARQNQQASEQGGLCEGGTCNDLSEEDLRTKDTDGDGLWDWDELNVYSTSPYLEDSDSDGFSDKQEIDSGNNPACAAGQECSDDLQIENTGFDDLSADLEGLDLEEIEKMLSGAESDSSASTPDSSLSGDELRQILKDSGVGDEILDMFTDEELTDLYSASLVGLEP